MAIAYSLSLCKAALHALITERERERERERGGGGRGIGGSIGREKRERNLKQGILKMNALLHLVIKKFLNFSLFWKVPPSGIGGPK